MNTVFETAGMVQFRLHFQKRNRSFVTNWFGLWAFDFMAEKRWYLTMPMKFRLCLLFVIASLCFSSLAAEKAPIRLLNGKDLEQFYAFFKDGGKNGDPTKVFRMEDGVLHVSGVHGYLSTKQEYGNYRLVAEFKWGKENGARKDKTRNSGIFIHAQGEDKIMPKSIEVQLQEGGTGDIVPITGASLTQNGVTKNKGRFDRPNRDPFEDKIGFRNANEVEKPLGEWNTVEVISEGEKLKVTVNGKVMFDGTVAEPRSGRILLECTGSEIYFRKADLYLR
jgi:hypothetical protein